MLSSTQSRNTGKRFCLIIFVFLFFQLSVQAQFNICPHGSYNMGVVYTHAVDDQVYWASRRDVTGTIVTADGGNTWTSNNFVDPRSFPVYCIHAFNADVAFVTASTIYKTTDRGTTWTAATGVFTNASSFPNTIHFFDQNNGVAMGDPVDGYFEIYTTTNGGVNWVRVPSSNIPTPLAGEIGLVNEHSYYNDSYWFTTFEKRVFMSTDRGYTWSCSQLPPSSLTFAPSVAFRDELNGLATSMNGFQSITCKTSDGGVTWVYNSLPNWISGIGSIAYIPGTQSTYTINSISYSGSEEIVMVLFTKDDGLTWNRMDALKPWINGDGLGYQQWTSVNSGWGSLFRGNEGCIYHWPGYTGKHIWRAASSLKYGSIFLGEIGDTITISIGNYGTLPTTINDLTLSSTNFSLVNPPATPLVLQPWNTIELNIAFTPQNLGLFNDSLLIYSDAANFSSMSTSLTGHCYEILLPYTDIFYASCGSGNNGDIITIDRELGVGTTVGSSLYGEIRSLAVNPSNDMLYGLVMSNTSEIVRVNARQGDSYKLFTLDLPTLSGIDFDTSGTLYASGQDGKIYMIDQMNGSYSLVTTATIALNSIAFNPITNQLWGAIRKTFGPGKDSVYTIDIASGVATPIGITGFSVMTNDMAFDEDNNLYGVTGTSNQEGKLFEISQVDGAGTLIGTGVGFNHTAGLAFSINGPIVYVGDEDSIIPAEYSLSQNYPNPFNPSTKISWQSPVGSQQTLKIYDVLGNEITTLIDEYKPAGRYELEFNASTLPSGVYFYQLKAGEFISTKKMLLLK